MVVTKNLSIMQEPAEKPLLYFSVLYLSHSQSPIPVQVSHSILSLPFQSKSPIPFPVSQSSPSLPFHSQSPIPFLVSHSVSRYLEQSILALDVSNEVTRSHMSPVLNGLAHHLTGMEKSLQSNPNSSGLARQVRRLRLVAEQLRQPHGR